MIDTAFILCGGEGTRLRPLTYDIPKLLLPVNGKPILEHNIDLLRNSGIRRIVLGTGYLGDQIKQYFGDGKSFGLKIEYSHEKERLGTAGALKNARELLKSTFVMCNGDELKEINIREMYEKHKNTAADITIALTSVQNPQSYGIAELDGDRIKQFLEKPENPPTNLINSGLYIIEPHIIDLIPEGKVSIEREIFPRIAEKQKLFGFKFKGQWFPTDTLERYEHAKKMWKSPF